MPYPKCYIAEGCGGDEACVALCPDVRRAPAPEYRCTTPGCTGDGRYAAPGRGHLDECRFPLSTEPTDLHPSRRGEVGDGPTTTDDPAPLGSLSPQPTSAEKEG